MHSTTNFQEVVSILRAGKGRIWLMAARLIRRDERKGGEEKIKTKVGETFHHRCGRE
jgi:hypothetical protein